MKRLPGLMLGANRSISFLSVLMSQGTEIRHGFQFISSLVGFCLVVLALTCPG